MAVFIIVGVLFFILMFFLLIAYPVAISRQCSQSSSQRENISAIKMSDNSIENLYGKSAIQVPSYKQTPNIQQYSQSTILTSYQPNQQPVVYFQQPAY
jgi:hypothetical protein